MRIGLFGLGGLLVSSLGGVHVTNQSSFCGSCHQMEPFYESWKQGSHAGVGCVECHIAPGTENYIMAKLNGAGQVVDDLLDRTSMKPSASVSDFSCTRIGCHQQENLGAAPADLPFHFDHKPHLVLSYKGVGTGCSLCHSHVKGDRHMEVNRNVCVTCHRLGHDTPGVRPSDGVHGTLAQAAPSAGPGAEGTVLMIRDDGPAEPAAPVATTRCLDCHDAPKEAFDHEGLLVDHAEYQRYQAACESCHLNATDPPEVVGNARCLQCHVYDMDDRPLDVEEMHRTHTGGEHKVECFNCHGVTRHGRNPAVTDAPVVCSMCHDPAQQHKVQREAYLHQESGPQKRVNPMLLVHVDCSGCHRGPSPSRLKPGSGETIARASAQSCDACHERGLGERVVPLWQKTTRRLFEEVSQLLPEAEQGALGASPEVREAKRLLELVRLDGSWGVHNPKYTEHLLETARQLLVDGQADEEPSPSEGPMLDLGGSTR